MSLGQRLLDDGEGLDIHRRRRIGINAEIVKFVRGCAAAYADIEPAVAEVVEHADLFGEPQRMVGRQHVNQWTETDTPRALRHRGKKHAG